MMYRRTRPSDRIQIREMLERHGISYDGREPLLGWVAVGEEDKLVGFSYAHQASIIEPFVCELPIAALKLLCLTEGSLSALNLNTVVLQVKSENKKLVGELRSLGFEQVEGVYTIFKKVV